MGKYDAQKGQYDGFDLAALTCYGCVHSAWSAPPPGKPAGAYECHFCVRNRAWRQDVPQAMEDPEFAGQDIPACIPNDAYHSIDMRGQIAVWIRSAATRDSEALEALLDMHRRLHPEKA